MTVCGFEVRAADMNTLIAVGTSVAYFYSTAVALAPKAFAQTAWKQRSTSILLQR